MKPKDVFYIICKAVADKLDVEMTKEIQFHASRKWRFDVAFPKLKIAVEYDGISTKGHAGRHVSITGMAKDHEKFNQAAIHGWVVVRFTALHFDGAARSKHGLSDPWLVLLSIIEDRKAQIG